MDDDDAALDDINRALDVAVQGDRREAEQILLDLILDERRRRVR